MVNQLPLCGDTVSNIPLSNDPSSSTSNSSDQFNSYLTKTTTILSSLMVVKTMQLLGIGAIVRYAA